jgi:hypothetical protein
MFLNYSGRIAGDSAAKSLAPWTAGIQCLGGGMLIYCTFMGIMAYDVKHPVREICA